ncbi:MAG: hypothetical protein D8M58_08595 [Calditrichaeota bacterium]|nr:MAG: hypothetical protein DWQ03_17895 [Calditrichota bacterium]MBL1205441.1 hypothetical protein [Calditrichota bacterium]
MNNTFSVSFSDNSFQLIHSASDGKEQALVSCSQHPYPNPVSVDQIFNPDNLLALIDAVNNLKTSNNLEDIELAFSLPFNYAKIKKVAYPKDSDKKLKRTQIEWELASVTSDNIKDFKISVLNENKKHSEYNEALIVAINKSLIKKLQYVAEESGAGISGVFLNCFSLENYLDYNKAFGQDQNYIFLKMGEKYIEHHYFLGKDYFSSCVDLVMEANNRSKEELVLELSNERYKQAVNIAGQMENSNKFNLIVFGNSVSESIVDTLKNGLSLSVEYAGIGNYSESDGYKYIEAWGSIL